MKTLNLCGRAVILCCGAFAAFSAAALGAPPPFGDLQYRWIGPAVMGGRLDVVAGVAGNPKLIYLGHSSGGLWKSEDGGLSFTSAFEAAESIAIGAIAIDPKDSRHVFIGTGEGFPRNTAEAGDGIWSTSDGGAHWRHLGLSRSGSLAKIAIDPNDSRVILAAAMGPEFAPGAQRGVYRSSDGGAHWTRVLYVNATTGGSDIAFGPKRSHVVYAGTFDFLRSPWSMRSGGPGSGLYVSHDSGKTWKRLTDPALRNGLPEGPINRVGVSVCDADPQIVYAFVPVKNGMLYRTVDGGSHWELRNASQDINFRPFYFSQIRCDPHDAQKVYAVAGGLLRSTDGGRKFRNAGGGGDNHDLWIDPIDSNRLLNGSDMGFNYSLDGGKTWSYDNVVPFDQVYRVGYDMDVPYHVMGGMQDHEVWWGPNERLCTQDGVGGGAWLNISDWGDGQYATADPRDPHIVYEDTHFGDLVRADLASGERRYISPQPMIGFGTGAGTYKYRFNWSAPLLISRFNPDVIYFGGNVLFKSTDQGDSWSETSGDLTRCDPAQLRPSGGPITFDDTNAESYCTIYTIGEDARDAQTLWYGTDNGHLEITRDGGRIWADVIRNVSGLPLPARVSVIAPSGNEPGVAYAAFDRHQWNDYTAYAYVTRDYGKTWASIGRGLDGFVHVVREDPRNRDLLYAGTESGIFVSFDAGAHWNDFRLGTPHVPVYDLQVHPRDNDLIVGTHGRGFYILDDLSALQQWTHALQTQVYLFAPMPAIRYANAFYREHGRGAFVSGNKPYGALLTLYLSRAPRAAPKRKPQAGVRILDSAGKIVDAFSVSVHAGLNRFSWDLRSLPPSGEKTVQDTRPYYIFYPLLIEGPQVPPGTYTIEVSALGDTVRQPAVVQMDPHHVVASGPLRAQYDALDALAGTQEQAEVAIARLSSVQRQIDSVRLRASSLPAVRDSLASFARRVTSELDLLRNPEPSGYRQPARLSEQIAYLRDTIEQYDGPPTQPQAALMRAYASQASAIDATLTDILGPDLGRLDALLREADLPELRGSPSGASQRR